MHEHLLKLLSSGFFLPHGHCYLWQPGMVWLQVVANAAIGMAYVVISTALYLLIRRVRGLPFEWIYLAFGVFIIACGVTHFMDVLTIWHPAYWLDGAIRTVTAVASVGTAVLLFRLFPRMVALAQAAELARQHGLQLENANQELARLLERSREVELKKTEFFATVSHELRTPLTLILGPAERLLHGPGLAEAQREDLLTIGRNGRLLLKHVNDLLDVSKLEAGKMDAGYTEVDLGRLLRLDASYFRHLAGERGIAFDVAGPETLPAQADADKMQRVLMNLLSNAFKFTPPGGRVRCSLALDGADGREELRLEVADSGPGIPPEHREAVFDRFRQLEGGPSRRFGGTGLGLAIARDFVALHGGSIRVADAPEGGALFVVRLPRRAPAGRAVRPAASADPVGLSAAAQAELELLQPRQDDRTTAPSRARTGERPLVLVVEDNREMNRFICETLAAECDTASAFDGEEGLRKAVELRPQLVISDVMMPGVSGDRLVERLRATPELHAVPLMLLTAKADDGMRIQLLEEGAQDYLTKPFLQGELRARARNLIRIQRTRELHLALEAARTARDQAEQANQVKSNFLNLVTHELRTPLTSLMLQIDRLNRRSGSELTERQHRILQRIAGSAARLSDLIESVLEYSRIEGGRLTVEVKTVDLLQTAHDALDELRSMAEHKHLDLRVSAVGEVPPLMSDPRLVRLILSNLAGNAVKFTPAGSVEVRLEHRDGLHRIAVIDTGPGIPQDKQGIIFEPFKHIEPIHHKHTAGMGLGLALVKEMVSALRGRIEPVSRIGQGSTFTVSLPGLNPLPAPAGPLPTS